MNLRRSTVLLILGLCYTVLHKALNTFFPWIAASGPGARVTNLLWLVATAALVLFAFQFLRELRPRDRRLRYSLISIIVFTSLVLVAKLPIWPASTIPLAQRPLFAVSRLLNAFAVVVFLASLTVTVAKDSSLRIPLRVATGACCLTLTLRIASTGHFLAFLATGREIQPYSFLQPLSVLSFVITSVAVLWFLIQFARVEDYEALIGERQPSPLPPPG